VSPGSRDTSEVMTLTVVGINDQSHIFQPEMGIRPKSCIRPES
jgi:hypothetical protein